MVDESEFTNPRLDCPHPEWWHAYDSMGAEVEVIEFIGVLVRVLQPELVVETGTWRGHTADVIGKSLVHNGHGHLITLEIDPELAREAMSNVAQHLPVKIEVADSHKYVPSGLIDLLWLDGSDDRVAEWRQLGRYLSKHGIVVVHDTGLHGEVRTALDAVGDIKLVHLPTPRGVSIGQKR